MAPPISLSTVSYHSLSSRLPADCLALDSMNNLDGEASECALGKQEAVLERGVLRHSHGSRGSATPLDAI